MESFRVPPTALDAFFAAGAHTDAAAFHRQLTQLVHRAPADLDLLIDLLGVTRTPDAITACVRKICGCLSRGMPDEQTDARLQQALAWKFYMYPVVMTGLYRDAMDPYWRHYVRHRPAVHNHTLIV